MATVKKKKIEKFVTSCSMVFKAYDYEVIVSKNKSNLWHFTANKKDKKYVVYCAPDINKVKGIIKVALGKVPKDTKLVVICENHTEEQLEVAKQSDYTLVTLHKIKHFGTELIEAKAREDSAA